MTLRPNRDQALNDLTSQFQALLEEEVAAAKERIVSRLAPMVRGVKAKMGPSFNVTGDPRTVATEIVEAAFDRQGEPLVDAWRIENVWANGSLEIQRTDLPVVLDSVIKTLRGALKDLPECKVESGPFLNRVIVIFTRFGTNFPEPQDVDRARKLVDDTMEEWARARNTGGSTNTITFHEDHDDTVTITVQL